ncbi:hypothetical protein ATANTOWER_008909 [Ataeniobius toweri]|uniref:Uncharacterized protein n=1 Tax=Ataeniobius toweri TaxID=208326 RepID=A0ABU7C744_9TELE|nr:hypothetical protein [Ataeniobius toweri]
MHCILSLFVINHESFSDNIADRKKVFKYFLMCAASRLLGPTTGQEGFAYVPLGLLHPIPPSQSQGFTQCFFLKNPFKGLVEKATLQSTQLFGDPRLHLTALIC